MSRGLTGYALRVVPLNAGFPLRYNWYQASSIQYQATSIKIHGRE